MKRFLELNQGGGDGDPAISRDAAMPTLVAFVIRQDAMQKPLSSNDAKPQPLLRRLDRVVGELNLFLVVLALGLGTLDFVCFVALRLVETLAQLPKAG